LGKYFEEKGISVVIEKNELPRDSELFQFKIFI
jgi:hypothetical protein